MDLPRRQRAISVRVWMNGFLKRDFAQTARRAEEKGATSVRAWGSTEEVSKGKYTQLKCRKARGQTWTARYSKPYIPIGYKFTINFF